MTIEIGDVAPGFQLPCKAGELVDVEAYLGREKVVLLFFPLAFSPVCTAELCRVSRLWDDMSELDARVFGISVDSPFVTDRFRREEGIRFPILSDFNRRVSERYGVLYEELLGLEGVSRRAVFVVGADGRVAWRWIAEEAGMEPDYDDLVAAVEAA